MQHAIGGKSGEQAAEQHDLAGQEDEHAESVGALPLDRRLKGGLGGGVGGGHRPIPPSG
jgi:hypothetical protein